MLNATDEYVVSLRRYIGSEKHPCAAGSKSRLGFCNAENKIDIFHWDGLEKSSAAGNGHRGEKAWGWGGDPVKFDGPYGGVTSYLDARWPKVCDACGQPFPDGAAYQLNLAVLFDRSDGGPRTTLDEAPAGAMYWADWYHGTQYVGADGKSLVVVLPGRHTWNVDSRANNCTRPDDNKHKCWVRHGEVPNITVDKNGDTCSAGAGSIIVPGWHGFLRNGHLIEC